VILGAFPATHPFIRAAYWLEKVLYFHSDLVTGTSAGICHDINARYPQVPTAVIPNAVDTNLFRPDCRDPAVRREFGLQEGQVAFIYAGLLGLSQGLEQVVETARLLRDRKDIRFILVGDGPRRQELIKLAQSLALDNITFPGVFPKKRIPSILASMDAALIPLMTTFPGAMPSKSYEALACGLPLVVASKADIAEFVAKHKVGFVVEPMDVPALVKVVQRLADDAALRRDLGIQARQVALQFDRDVVARRTSKLFEDLVGSSSGSKKP
jgi:glycosyltransferase involved in cell wall biosynthesis